jgi:hypothetical protein
MLAQIKPNLMVEYIGTDFDVLDNPAQVFCLGLAEIVEHGKTKHNESFSLFFRGPSNRFMPQGIHRLKHAKLGELEIFLVPTAQDKNGFQYEAVFNHML